MIPSSINLLEELDSASSIHCLKRDDIDVLIEACAKRITHLLEIERCNAWLFNANHTAIVSFGEYDKNKDEFSKNTIIYKSDCPNYFSALRQNKILLIPNIRSHKYTKEFNESYSIPNNIISLMDIPLRIDGELIGVLCLEKTGEIEREFSNEEQTFAMSIGIILTSSLEARQRRKVNHLLEESLKEKDLLIKEINHRVKNNFSILISLLHLAKNKNEGSKENEVLKEFEQRVIAMLKIHDLLHQTKNYTSVNLSAYIKEITNEFQQSFAVLKMKVSIDYLELELTSRIALHLGLIVTEILLNCIKHGEITSPTYFVEVKLRKNGNNTILSISNSGKCFDFNEKLKLNTLGLSLISDLANDIDVRASYPTVDNCIYKFEF
ncbi:MAG: hypothetical protein CO022_05830 [Flavobacteriales bacterium CG_4_9_14_0_2_um_filter_32_27]|nr:MAG: hypothetical protein CO022_05830 [Flavobacteriales bacterium CG_4_9_14_0_2_um_filter_32_27]